MTKQPLLEPSRLRAREQPPPVWGLGAAFLPESSH